MNSLARVSTYSLARISTHSLSGFTIDTDTTASTEWGPGTVMGRGLMAFGEAAKDALDKLFIRRRLSTFKSIFPHTNVIPCKVSDQAYWDLFELCRPGAYNDEVRQKALAILLTQIGSQQTSQLISSLSEWPAVEIRLLIREIVCCLPPAYLPSGISIQEMHKTLCDVYTASLQNALHAMLPFVDFIYKLALATDDIRKAILDVGVLRILISILSIESSVYAVFRGTKKYLYTQELLNGCCAALIILTKNIDAECPRRHLPLGRQEVDSWIVELAWSQLETGEVCRLVDALDKCSAAEQWRFICEMVSFASIWSSLPHSSLPLQKYETYKFLSPAPGHNCVSQFISFLSKPGTTLTEYYDGTLIYLI